jgi:hypothetical protein
MSDFTALLLRHSSSGVVNDAWRREFGKALLELSRSAVFGRSAIKEAHRRPHAPRHHSDDVEEDQCDGECAWHTLHETQDQLPRALCAVNAA